MQTSNEKTISVRTVYLATIFCATVLLAAGGASGDDIYWNNPIGGSFNLDTNWNPMQVPGEYDTAIFDLASTYYVIFESSVIDSDACHFHTDNVTMDLGGYTYALQGDSLMSARPMVVGVHAWDSATVAMSNGELQTSSAQIGLWENSSGVLEITDNMWMDVTGRLTVGNDGDGELNVSEYSGVTTQELHVGSHGFGNTGTVNVTGMADLTVNSDCFMIGVDPGSKGYLTVSEGANVFSTHAGGWIKAGDQPGSYGEILVEDGALLDAEAAPMMIGNHGDGKLTVTGSKAHSSGELFVAGVAGSTGNVLITSESEYISDSVYPSKIGDAGTGTLTIDHTSLFQGYAMVIGNQSTGDGTVTLRDSESTLDVNFLRVGREGVGRLEVNDGRVAMGDIDPATVLAGEVHVGPAGIGIGRGELGGTGTIACKVINIGGEVRPGGTILPTRMTGILNIEGDFEQQTAGTLVIEIGGLVRSDEYSALDVTGELAMGGTLKIELIDGFQPENGNTFDILGGGTFAGAFDAFDLPDLGSELDWDTSNLSSTGEISVIPEPASVTILLLGAIAVFRRRRK